MGRVTTALGSVLWRWLLWVLVLVPLACVLSAFAGDAAYTAWVAFMAFLLAVAVGLVAGVVALLPRLARASWVARGAVLAVVGAAVAWAGLWPTFSGSAVLVAFAVGLVVVTAFAVEGIVQRVAGRGTGSRSVSGSGSGSGDRVAAGES